MDTAAVSDISTGDTEETIQQNCGLLNSPDETAVRTGTEVIDRARELVNSVESNTLCLSHSAIRNRQQELQIQADQRGFLGPCFAHRQTIYSIYEMSVIVTEDTVQLSFTTFDMDCRIYETNVLLNTIGEILPSANDAHSVEVPDNISLENYLYASLSGVLTFLA